MTKSPPSADGGPLLLSAKRADLIFAIETQRAFDTADDRIGDTVKRTPGRIVMTVNQADVLEQQHD